MNLPLPEQAVLIADDLLPSELTALDRQRLVAICLGGGGATSHVAILAATMEIPMLVGLGLGTRDYPRRHYRDRGRRRRRAEVDADGVGRRAGASDRRIAGCRAAPRPKPRHKPNAARSDGTRIEVFANLGNVQDAAVAVANGAEGCGLLRTEFLFIDRETAPDEAEQLAAYQGIAAALGDRPLILRLMDVGGDKPLRYLPLPAEENPALGLARHSHRAGASRSVAHPAARGAAGTAGRQRAAAHSHGHRPCGNHSPCAASIGSLLAELGVRVRSNWARWSRLPLRRCWRPPSSAKSISCPSAATT